MKKNKQSILLMEGKDKSVKKLEIPEEATTLDTFDIYNIENKAQLYDNDKLKIIKQLRVETGMGLSEAVEIVNNYFAIK